MRTRRFVFGREERLLQRSRFLYLSRRGRRLQNALFILCYDRSQAGCSRLGITVTKKVGGAVTRNRIKRVCREFFRHRKHIIKNAWDINLIAKRQAASLSNSVLVCSLDQLFKPLLRQNPG